MSDFFGEYFAPGAFFTGAAITGYKTIKELSGSNSVKSIWTAHKESTAAFANIKAARGNQHTLSHTEIIDSLFFKTNRYLATPTTYSPTIKEPGRRINTRGIGGRLGGASKFRKKTMIDRPLKEGLRFIRGEIVSSAIDQFQLHSNAQALGINLAKPELIRRGQLEELMKMSPRHKEFIERAVSSYGLGGSRRSYGDISLGLMELKKEVNVRKNVLQAREAFGHAARERTTISSIIESNQALFADLSPARFDGDPIKIRTKKDLNRLRTLGRGDSGDLIEKSTALFDKVREMRKQGVKMNMQLLTLKQGSGIETIRGIRITSGKSKSVLDIPFVDHRSRVRTGFYGQREMIAKKVGLSDYSKFFQGQGGSPARNVDLALMDKAIDNFDEFSSKRQSWYKFFKSLIDETGEEAGKVFLPVTANEALNAKNAQLATFADNGLNIKNINVEAIDQMAIAQEIDTISGLSPSQITSDVRAMRDAGDRPYGVEALGQATGDDKTIAQMPKPKVMIDPSRARATVQGANQAALKDVHAQMRTYAFPQEVLESMLGNSSRADIGLHEDVAILLGDVKRRFIETDRRTISGGSLASERIQDLLGSSYNQRLLEVARSKEGVQGRLSSIAAALKSDLPPDLREMLEAEADYLTKARVFTQDEVIGQLPQGGLVRGSKEGEFLLDKLNYVKRTGEAGDGKLIMEGYRTRQLDTFDKTYGWKRVFSGKISPNEGRYMAAVFEATKDTPEIVEALRNLNSSDEAISSQASDFIKNTYNDYMQVYRDEAFELTKTGHGLPSLSRMSVPGIADDVWQTAVSRVADVEALDVQGWKKIGQRTMGQTAASLTSGLANELVRLKGERMTVHDTSDMKALLRSREHNAANYEKILAIQESLDRIGIRGIKDGVFIMDDFLKDDPTGSKNLANRMDQILLETMHEGTTHGAGRWSSKRLFEDLANAKGLTKKQRLNRQAWTQLSSEESAHLVREMIAKGGKSRDMVILGLQDQLQYGAHTASFSVGGSSRHTGGSGRRGSINSTMLEHLKEQGGVMSELSDEIAGRIANDNIDNAKEVLKRAAAFHAPETLADTKAISMREFVSKNSIDSDVMKNLFGRNQVARSHAFSQIREQFGIDKGKGLLFDLGEEGGGKKIYHPEDISIHTGAFTGDDGVARMSGIDKGMEDIMRGFKAQNPQLITDALSTYDQELANITFGKKQALSKLLGGKVQGSLRALAVPQRSREYLESLDLGEFTEHKIGIRESRFKNMLEDVGVSQSEIEERVKRLRLGTEGGIVARQPGTELHRISNVNFYSIDEMFNKAKIEMATHWDHLQIIEQIKHVNPQLYRDHKKEFAKMFSHGVDELIPFENTPAIKRQKADFWADIWEKGMLREYDDNAVYLPKQIEQILGADFDDDQLDVFFAKSKELNERLRMRSTYQTELIGGKRKVGDATKPWELLAEEDYTYKENQRALYKGLKDRVQPTVIGPEGLKAGTPAWRQKMEAQALMAQFEKGYIGGMTNSTDFVRDVLRSSGRGARTGEARLFTEMLLGIIPETALKARQHGPFALMNPEYGLKEGIQTLQKIMSGKVASDGATIAQQVDMFNEAFRSVHGTSDLTDRMLKFTPDVIGAIKGASDRPENLLKRFAKKDPSKGDFKQLLKYAMDPDTPSPQRAAMMEALSEMGGEVNRSPMGRNMKKAAASFNEVFNAVKKHKKPILIGAAVATSAAMFLSSPGSISADEADAAGARHTPSEPTPPAPEFNNTAPVSTGSGRSIRIRGRANGALNTGSLSERIQAKFPGADVSYTLNDFRERINEEYLRKRFTRD